MRPFRVVPALAIAAACAVPEPIERPVAPRLEGDVPAIGRTLDLRLGEGAGAVRLTGVVGRVTLVCVLDGAAGPARPAEEPAPEAEGAAPGPPAGELARRVPGGERPQSGWSAGSTDLEPPVPDDAATSPAEQEAAPRPKQADGGVAETCARAAARWRDRIAVVGLAPAAAFDPRTIPFRTYADPGGRAVRESLELEPAPRILVIDRQGRVAEIVEAAELGGLERRLEGLAR